MCVWGTLPFQVVPLEEKKYSHNGTEHKTRMKRKRYNKYVEYTFFLGRCVCVEN